jgi:hypothetical protein
LSPVNAVIEHVITSCVPGERVGWIDHAVGVALGQWVTFEQHAKGTLVHTWGDIVHSGVTIGGRSVEHLVKAFTHMWYENFRAMCDQLVEGQAAAGD